MKDDLTHPAIKSKGLKLKKFYKEIQEYVLENSDKCLWTFQLESNTTYSSQFYRHLQKSFSFAPLALRS